MYAYYNGTFFTYRNGIDKIFNDSGKAPLTKDYIKGFSDGETAYYEELNAGPKKLPKSIDLKFGEEESISIECKPLEVVFETNLGQCEYKF